jgi:hypothetical protein
MRITNHQSRMLPKYVLLWAVLQTTTKDDQMCLIYLIYFTALPPRNYLMFQNIMFVLGEPYIVYIYTCIHVYIYYNCIYIYIFSIHSYTYTQNIYYSCAWNIMYIWIHMMYTLW